MSKITPSFEGLEALRPYTSNWCAWKLKANPQRTKPEKVPYQNPRKTLSSNTTDEWLSFDDARALYDGGRFDGVGVLMLDADMLVCIDFDACINDKGELMPTAQPVADELLAFATCCELSQSGNGLHFFTRGFRLENAKEKIVIEGGHSLEIYDTDSERYIAVTGVLWPIGSPVRKVELCQAKLENFMIRHGFVRPVKVAGGGVAPVCDPCTDDEIMKLLMVRNKRGRVSRLLKGDFDGDHSAADFELCCEVAYFTRDAGQIDAVIRGSGLMRPKWDSQRGAETYGERTIRQALATQTRSFDEDRAAKAAEKATSAAKAVELKSRGAAQLVGGIDDLLDDRGRMRPTLHTVVELLLRDRSLAGSLYYDEFAQKMRKTRGLSEVLGKMAPDAAGDVVDDDLRALAFYLGREWRLDLKIATVADAVALWARNLSRNPVRERLDELADGWDGEKRLTTWLIEYCKAVTGENDGIAEYVQEVGKRWLIQLVARAYQPGCQADSMLVLEGFQGARKSTAARVLCEAIDPDVFLEGFSLEGQSVQDRALSLEGRLMVEWSELSGLTRHEVGAVKQFLTQKQDPYRRPYDRATIKFNRTAVFIASTNDSAYLSDLSGNRRFWPVRVGVVDIGRLKGDAGQIIGEAVHEYRAGTRWWFDPNLLDDKRVHAHATTEQMGRLIPGFYDDAAMDLAMSVRDIDHGLPVGFKPKPGQAAEKGTERILYVGEGARLAELMHAAGIESQDDSGGRSIKFARALTKAGWQRYESKGRSLWRLPELTEQAIECLRAVQPKVPPTRNAQTQKRGTTLRPAPHS